MDLLTINLRQFVPVKLTLLIASCCGTYYVWKIIRDHHKNKHAVSMVNGNCNNHDNRNRKQIKILYGSEGGKAKRLAHELEEKLKQKFNTNKISLLSIKDYDPEDNIQSDAKNHVLIIILISTYSDGSYPSDASWFGKWLDEAANDFRMQKYAFDGLNFAILGLGDSAYGDHFCLAAKNIDKFFKKLQASPIINISFLDESSTIASEKLFSNWINQLDNSITKLLYSNIENVPSLHLEDNQCEDDQCEDDQCEDDYESDDNDNDEPKQIMDIEDIAINKNSQISTNSKPEMITPNLRKELTKQGYKLIGTHSGVKLCRWTKSMLRGRGNMKC